MDFIPYISFLTGVVSIISPCIIPVIPILFGFTIKNKDIKEIIAFTLGLFSISTLLIFVTAFFQVMFYSYVYYVRILSSVVLLAIGLIFIFDKTFNLSFKVSSQNAFILGVLTSLSWSPCYGGYLISLLSVLITAPDTLYITFNIILYSLGFGLTLLVLSYVISKINVEKLVKGSSYIRQITGILFIIGGVFMLLNANGVLL